MFLTSAKVGGVDVEVHVYSDGRFMLQTPKDDGGEMLGIGDTLEQAKTTARKELNKRKVKVEVPFLTANGEKGTATGLHAGTRKVLTTVETYSGTRSEQIETYAKRYKADTPAKVLGRLADLREMQNKAAVEIRALDGEYQFTVGAAVKQAIEAAAAEQEKEAAAA